MAISLSQVVNLRSPQHRKQIDIRLHILRPPTHRQQFPNLQNLSFKNPLRNQQDTKLRVDSDLFLRQISKFPAIYSRPRTNFAPSAHLHELAEGTDKFKRVPKIGQRCRCKHSRQGLQPRQRKEFIGTQEKDLTFRLNRL